MVGDILQPTHLVFVLVVALLVLGPKRLPEVGRQLGNGLRDFRAAINGERSEHHDEPSGPYVETETNTYLGKDAPESHVEHEFAHDASETTTDGHEFAHDASETTTDGHEFAHDASETTVDGHEFAHDASQTVAGEHEFAHEDASPGDGTEGAEAAPKPDSQHEFAYETSESAQKRTDPSS
jgi:sec-independent protein translocase protein TatA